MADHPDFKTMRDKAKAYGHTLDDYVKDVGDTKTKLGQEADNLVAQAKLLAAEHAKKLAKAKEMMGKMHGDYVKLMPLQKQLKEAQDPKKKAELTKQIDKIYGPNEKKQKEVAAMVKDAQAVRDKLRKAVSMTGKTINALSS